MIINQNHSENAIISSDNKYINPKNIFIMLVIAVFIKMLVLNFLTPLLWDDFAYATSTSVIDAIQREYIRYMEYNGRSVTGFLFRIFLMMPKFIFNIFNALVFTCFTLIIYKISIPKRENHISLYLFILFSIWLYTLAYDQVILWLVGTISYLWAVIIILSFLLPYCLYLSDKPIFKHKYIPIAGMLLLGILAGWCSENTSGGMILIVILLFVYCLIYKQKIQMWMIGGLIGGITGFLIMILAPGFSIKSQRADYIDERHILVALTERFTIVTDYLRNDFVVLIVFFIILITIQIIHNKDWKRTYISFTFFIASIATAYALVLSPWIPERTMIGTTVFLIIACAYTLAGISFDNELYKIAFMSFICILAFQFSTSFVVALRDFGMTKLAHNRLEAYIESEIATGNLDVVIPISIVPRSETRWISLFSKIPYSDEPHWFFHNLYWRYGMESIKIDYNR